MYRPALKPEFQGDLDPEHPMPRYAISATLDVDNLILTGTAQIVVPNTSSDPWPNLVFRLYPMLEHYGGNMVVMSALVNGKPATFDYTNDNTALQCRPGTPPAAQAGGHRPTQLAPQHSAVGQPIQSSMHCLAGRRI